MPIRILIPQVNKWDVGGGVQKILAATYKATSSPEPLILDFAGCSFLSAEATALLASIFLDRRRRGFSTEVSLAFVQADVGRHLDRTGLLQLCGAAADFSPSGSSLPLLTTKVLDRGRILRYIDQELMGREEMPTMTARLQKDIRQAFFEVIGNIFYHSGPR